MTKLVNRVERLEIVNGSLSSSVDAIEIVGILPGGAEGTRAIWHRGQPNFVQAVNDDRR